MMARLSIFLLSNPVTGKKYATNEYLLNKEIKCQRCQLYINLFSVFYMYFYFTFKVSLDSFSSPKKQQKNKQKKNPKNKTKHQVKSIKIAIYNSKAITPGRLLNHPYVPSHYPSSHHPLSKLLYSLLGSTEIYAPYFSPIICQEFFQWLPTDIKINFSLTWSGPCLSLFLLSML